MALKITEFDYKRMEKSIDNLIENKGIEAIGNHKALNLGKDKDMRFRWDLLRYSGFDICSLYTYMNDDHINSALKKIISDRNL